MKGVVTRYLEQTIREKHVSTRDRLTSDSKIASVFMKILHGLSEKSLQRRRKTQTTVNVFDPEMNRTDDPRAFQNQRHGRYSSGHLRLLGKRDQGENEQTFYTKWDETIIVMQKQADEELLEIFVIQAAREI